MSQFQFVMRSGPTPGKVFPIDGNEIGIGRDASQTISINDAEISRKHAKMELRGTSYVIQDLGSTNGTFVNGNRISGIQVLNPNDIVSFGENIVLMYELIADPNATMLSSKPPRTAAGIHKPAPAPVVAPVSTPVQAPAAAPVYTSPTPGATPVASAPTKRGNKKLIFIIVLVVVGCLIIGCIGSLLWADADVTGARWCSFPFRWIANILAGIMGYPPCD